MKEKKVQKPSGETFAASDFDQSGISLVLNHNK